MTRNVCSLSDDCTVVSEKGQKFKNNLCDISPICTKALHGRICTKFGTSRGVADVITYDKRYGDQMSGVDYVGGQNLLFPVDKSSRC